MKSFPRLLAAAALPIATLIAFAGPASAVAGITVTPSSGIPATGTTILTVSGTGFAPGDTAVMSLCVDAARQAGGATFAPLTDCDTNTQTSAVDPVAANGTFSDTFDVVAGNLTNGLPCNSTHPCRIRVSGGTFASTATQVFFDISFAAPVVVTTTTTVAGPPADVPDAPLPILLPLGAAAVLGAGYMMVRKGRISSAGL